MRQSGDGLHLDGVHLVQRMIKHTGRINNLPSQILVVHVTDKKRFCSEGIRLHIDVGSSDFVEERRLADVWIATNEQRACCRIYSGQTRHMLADLFKVSERVFLPLHDGGHSVRRRHA